MLIIKSIYDCVELTLLLWRFLTSMKKR